MFVRAHYGRPICWNSVNPEQNLYIWESSSRGRQYPVSCSDLAVFLRLELSSGIPPASASCFTFHMLLSHHPENQMGRWTLIIRIPDHLLATSTYDLLLTGTSNITEAKLSHLLYPSPGHVRTLCSHVKFGLLYWVEGPSQCSACAFYKN